MNQPINLQQAFDNMPKQATQLNVVSQEAAQKILSEKQLESLQIIIESQPELFQRYEELQKRAEAKAQELNEAQQGLARYAPRLVDAPPKERANLLTKHNEQFMLVSALKAEHNELVQRRDAAYIAIFTTEQAIAQTALDHLATEYRSKSDEVAALNETHRRQVNDTKFRGQPNPDFERNYGSLRADILVLGREVQKAKSRVERAKRGVSIVSKELNLT
jgi:hypothetical protein